MIIYKYLPPKRIDVLENQYLRCTPANNQNDIFEMRPYFNNIVDSSQRNDLFSGVEIDISKYFDDLYNKLPANIRNLFDKDKFKKEIKNTLKTKQGEEVIEKSKSWAIDFLNSNIIAFQEQIYKTNIQITGTISFSEIFNSKRMWALFSNSHKGFQIGFNSTHYFFNRPRTEDDEYFRIRKVLYDTEDKIKTLYGADGVDLLLRKRMEWQYENEWRLLIPLFYADKIIDSKDEKIHLVKFPTDCILSITFGVNSNDKLKDSIFEIIENKKLRHIKIGQTYVDKNEPKLGVRWLNADIK